MALVRDDVVEAEYTLNVQRTHSERLMPALVTVVKDAGLAPRDLELITVTTGPGSFTGLRIGIATAKGLSYALGCALVGVPTLDALAYGACQPSGLVVPALDARRREVYAAVYRAVPEGVPERVSDWLALPLEELLSRLEDAGTVTWIGDGTMVNRRLIAERMGDRARFVAPARGTMRAAWVAELGRRHYLSGETVGPHELLPLYIRESQAVARLSGEARC